RFGGQALREALAAEGFVYGPLEIFHRAAADGRVIFSAASLTKPGTFELGSMDAERYVGVNLFGVLPGPVPGVELLDDLLATGRELAARLDGELQSEQGEPFTAAHIEALRAALVPVVQPAAMAPDEPVAG
ncbi:MAG: cell division protein ZipA C-terminal FtsZ-binding domain-containing protein, partial [Steroidobacteraceae bacterium]